MLIHTHEPEQDEDVVPHWVIYASGAVGELHLPPGTDPTLAEGDRLVTQAEYEAVLAEIEAEREAGRAAEEAAALEARRAAYEELIALGLSEETARRISGYTHPEEES